MGVLPAKRQEENCTGRYSKGLRNQIGNIFVNQTTLMKHRLVSSYTAIGLVNQPELYLLC